MTRLTAVETEFLDGWTERFATELDEHLSTEGFLGWAVAQVGGAALGARAAAGSSLLDPGTSPSDPAGWDAFWDRDPLAAAALARWWAARRLALPAGFRPPPGTEAALELGDRLVLVDAWLHHPDALIDESVRDRVRKLATRYGVPFTTAGIRWGRSVADLVCARSSAKGSAAADVLAAEAGWRGDGCGPWSWSNATRPPTSLDGS